MFKSSGKLIYSPRTHLKNADRWLVMFCDDELSKYYRHIFGKEFPHKHKLTRPVWGTHISIIRNEKIACPNLWRMCENKIIEFEYEPGVQSNDEYYWLKVHCDELLDLREKYGLKRDPQFGLHLTIGRKIDGELVLK